MLRISLMFLVAGACVPVEEVGEVSQAEYGLEAPTCTAQVVCSAGHWLPVFDCTTRYYGKASLVKWSDGAQNFLEIDFANIPAGSFRMYDSQYNGGGRYIVVSGGKVGPFELSGGPNCPPPPPLPTCRSGQHWCGDEQGCVPLSTFCE